MEEKIRSRDRQVHIYVLFLVTPETLKLKLESSLSLSLSPFCSAPHAFAGSCGALSSALFPLSLISFS
eukprot:1326853-Amorphochlora_amoeboformis.AAC.1